MVLLGGWDKVKKGLVALDFKSRPLANITLNMTWLLVLFCVEPSTKTFDVCVQICHSRGSFI